MAMLQPAEFAAFGEVMLRLSPPGHKRLAQTTTFDVCFGGGEANVAVALSHFGVSSRFVTALPDNPVGAACLADLTRQGLDVSFVQTGGDRLGIYFLEHGAGPRSSVVTYDRRMSAFATIDPDGYDWDRCLAGVRWFHFTGITPALSDSARIAVAQAAATAKGLGARVSCDLNYRSKLWPRDVARRVMTELMSDVDTLFANEEDADAVFGISAVDSDVESGRFEPDRYADVAHRLRERFGFTAVAVSLRESRSAWRNGWSGLLYADGEPCFSRRYDIDIVDRVGSGDAYAAGIIYGLLHGKTSRETVEFGAAAGALAHTIPGDYATLTVNEVEALVQGGGSGRVRR